MRKMLRSKAVVLLLLPNRHSSVVFVYSPHLVKEHTPPDTSKQSLGRVLLQEQTPVVLVVVELVVVVVELIVSLPSNSHTPP